ncbi:MAG: TlpA family protein disulfide reductase [Prevotellaceae bacterium]|jgi:thiol-disulfide isomerase/thioredoxin|nr:TlpA family protein disulfide reductase [Prevotellaceae bacterium]
MKKIVCILIALIVLSGCGEVPKNLANGKWRGVFFTPDNIEIPFLFEVSGTRFVMLINGEERISLPEATYRNDSIFIPIPAYDAILEAKIISEEEIRGNQIKLYSGSQTPFKAIRTSAPRFISNGEYPKMFLTGQWQIIVPENDSAKQVGIFTQKDSYVTGSILTSTGDYRYLEGAVQGKKFYLSTFGGLTPYLVKGEFTNANSFTAEFITPSGGYKFDGMRNDNAILPDAYSTTSLNQGYSKLNFSLPNLEGKTISINDSKYTDKVVVVSILGSWCPNCLDEAAFLAPWYKENKDRGVEVIGLAFERKDDFEYAQQRLTQFKNKYQIEYEILFAGKVGKEAAQKALPELEKIPSYPTTIFLDKNGVVRKIHSGFNGPATGKYYEEFKEEFNRTINELLQE